MKIHLVFVFIVMSICNVYADECGPFGCMFNPGTKCVNGVCLPDVNPTPTPVPTTKPSEVRLDMVPLADIVGVAVDCSGMDMKQFKVILKRKTPPPFASFYSSVFYFYKDFSDETKITYFFARKDLLNRYVFILLDSAEVPKPQFYGTDFAFNLWTNPAYNDFFASKTCEELKASNLFFNCGISIKGDMSDFEGATFTFK